MRYPPPPILALSDSELHGLSNAGRDYFIDVARYVGIPLAVGAAAATAEVWGPPTVATLYGVARIGQISKAIYITRVALEFGMQVLSGVTKDQPAVSPVLDPKYYIETFVDK